jgi:hypothetical protein
VSPTRSTERSIGRWLPLAIVAALALSGCRLPGRAGPPFSPVTFTLDSTGEVEVDAAPKLVTALGRFDVDDEAQSSLPVGRDATLVVIRHVVQRRVIDSAWRITSRDELAIRIDEDAAERVAGRRAFVDASVAPVRSVVLDRAGPAVPGGARARAWPVARVAGSLSGTWKGTYVCAQGVTGLTLVVAAAKGRARATFSFYPVRDNPGVPKGSFAMTGGYTSRSLDLEPDHWIAQPKGYVMIDLPAVFSPARPDRLEGRWPLGHPCSTFALAKVAG